ncbi:MAG TPA: CBS domain-containing protein [Candidatus Dormibacteraeota bacterium]
MTQIVRQLMTPKPKTVDAGEPVANVAKVMRDQAVGAVVVVHGERVKGIVTDRDIAIRAVAERRDPWNTRVGDITSEDVVSLSPEDPVNDAIELMRRHAVRRLPVVEGGKPVGIVSIGDLAQDRDPTSALADISAAPANR